MAMYLAAFLAMLAFNNLDMQDKFLVSFERSGGFAGISSFVTIDADTMNIDEKLKLQELIENSEFFQMDIDDSSNSGARDQFIYKLSIEIGNQKKSLTLTEPDITDKLRPLINYLSQKARMPKR